MIPWLIALVVGLAFTAGILLVAFSVRTMCRQYEGRISDCRAELERAYTRIAFLELTLDEHRAAVLSTSLPAPIEAPSSAFAPLPEKIAEELAQIEDPEHRAELEEAARHWRDANPDSDPAEIVEDLFR